MYHDKPIYIIGSGYSRSYYDLDRIKDNITIACNYEMKLAPWATFGAFLDRVQDCSRTYIESFAGPVFTRESSRYTGSNAVILPTINDRIGNSFSGVCCDNMTGFFAINVALLLTKGNIILIGFDLDSQDGHCYHKDHINYNYTGKIIYKTTANKGTVQKFDQIFGGQKDRIFKASDTGLLDLKVMK